MKNPIGKAVQTGVRLADFFTNYLEPKSCYLKLACAKGAPRPSELI